MNFVFWLESKAIVDSHDLHVFLVKYYLVDLREVIDVLDITIVNSSVLNLTFFVLHVCAFCI
jgi:hypothetical protein